MTFIAKLDSVLFKAMIDALTSILKEVRLHLEEDGIHAISVDSANVAMVVMHVPIGAFAEYQLDEPKAIGIDLEKIHAILTTMGKGDTVTLTLNDKEKKLNLRYGGYDYFVQLIAESTIRKDPTEPVLDLPGAFEVPGGLFAEAVHAAAGVSERIWLKSEPDKSVFVIEGSPAGGIEGLRRTLTGAEVSVEKCDEKVSSLFSHDYLQDIAKIVAKSRDVSIKLGNDHPVLFECDYERVHLKYLLAPRIENE